MANGEKQAGYFNGSKDTGGKKGDSDSQVPCGLLTGSQEELCIQLCDCRQPGGTIGIFSISEIMEICYGSFYQRENLL